MPFESLGLKSALVEGVAAMGYSSPTPIQGQAIPEALAGRDIIGCAQTGTGKTAAFLLPTLQQISHAPGIKALILTPTRELATQVEEVAKACARFTKRKVVAVFGGASYHLQRQALKRGADVLVATPGRLLDMVHRGDIKLSRVEVFVLDEADRMLDMGFLPDIKRVIRALPSERQNMLFSATMSPGVIKVIEDTLENPVSIEIGEKVEPAKAIEQLVYPVSALQKSDLLVQLLQEAHMKRVLVFARTKRRADRLCRVLTRANITAAPIHSDRSQAQRQTALAGFKNGRFRVLVATDLVARGVDVERVSHVINFDVPSSPEDYVHRVGRTARANTTGMAVTFLSAEEIAAFRDIESFIGQTLACKDLEGFEYEQRYIPKPDRVAKRSPKMVFNGGARSGSKHRSRRR